jgi:hypothetical protein
MEKKIVKQGRTKENESNQTKQKKSRQQAQELKKKGEI